jgi:hypothetical protein
MLTHTDCHYLAAILTQIASPWGVEIDLGELVEDVAGEEGRDVDITVRYRLPGDTVAELHAIEVKDEQRPLDIAHVEQIVIKLRDMPALTHHALVSSSGFTGPAKQKARYHGLQLYHLRDWDGKGLRVDMSQCAPPQIETMEWESVTPVPVVDGTQEELTFDLQSIIHNSANPNAKRTFGELLDSVCNIVLNDASSKLDHGAESNQIAVNIPVNFLVPFQARANGKLETIKSIVIKGIAVRKVFPSKFTRKVLARDEDNSLIAGCMLSELPDRSLWALMTTSTEGSLTARIISVTDRGKKKIYKERMQSISPGGPLPVDSI